MIAIMIFTELVFAVAQPASQPSTRPEINRESLVTAQFEKIEAGDFGDKITFRMQNKSGKGIESCIGGVDLSDRFGNHLARLEVTHDKLVANNESWVYQGAWVIDARTKELLKKQPSTVKVKFVVKQIAFDDGTQEDFGRR